MSNTTKVLITLACGVVAGAVVGLLLAPDKGSETRKKVADAAGKISDKLKFQAKKMANGMKKEAVDEAEEVLS